jgi:hypothetical protein
MVAAGASRAFALAPDDEAAPLALVDRLLSRELQIEFAHPRPDRRLGQCPRD